MEAIIQTQAVLKDRISKAYVNLKKLGANKITMGAVEARLEVLRGNWKRYEDQHIQLLTEGKDELLRLPYFKEDQFSVAEELFCVEEAKFLDKLRELEAKTVENSPPSGGASTSTAVSATAARSRASLPRLPLPHFDGRYETWPEFRDSFRSLVVRDDTITDVDRLHYLKGCLKDDALLALRNLPTRDETFERAWSILKEHYENERLLVKAQMSTIFKLPSLTRDPSADLKKFYFSVNDFVEALAAMKRPFDGTGDWLVHRIVERLDQQSRREWETLLGEQTSPPAFPKLKSFLATRIRTVTALEEQRGGNRGSEGRAAKSGGGQRTTRVHQATKQKRAPEQCGICKGNHFILFCGAYKAKSARERKAVLTELNQCYNCLGRHHVADCRSERRCQRCERKHHTSIHDDTHAMEPTSEPAATVEEVSTNTASDISASCPAVLLATARIKVLPSYGEPRVVRALIDQGSEVSLVTEALVQELRLRRKPSDIRIVGIGGRQTSRVHGRVHLEFKPYTTAGRSQGTTALVLPKITSYRPRLGDNARMWAHLQGIQLADPSFAEDGPIDVLLGADAYSLILEDGVLRGGAGEPVAQRTSLGWIVSGPVCKTDTRSATANSGVLSFHSTLEEELLPLLRRFWEQEELTEPATYTVEEQQCEDHFQRTHQRLKSGRYMLRLPFREDAELGESRHGAKLMLTRMEARFRRDPAFANSYKGFMREYEDLTHMSKKGGIDLLGPGYYLPHHGVLKESSITTKLRVVFNGSYLTTSGKSLNDQLLVGPSLLPDLQQLLLRWRTHKICLTADIEKMYRQILIHPEDRRFQRILWRDKEEDDRGDYELNTVTYGLACAPYLAIRTLHQLAADEQSRYPRAAEILQRDVYMDDVTTGADSEKEALELQEELRGLCLAGGFNLRKWASNRTALTETLPVGDAIPEIKWQEGETHTTLGVHWSLTKDCFRVRVKQDPPNEPVTRRRVLSKRARIFDPLGLVSPVTITAKMFMQSLWLLNLDWDAPLPAAEEDTWSCYLTELPDLNSIRVPRWLGLHPSIQSRELHGFADASEWAYAAVIYLRVVDCQGQVRTQIVNAKTKVAPLKRISLPRLELCAATLLSRLMVLTRASLGLKGVDIHLWSDSTITLAWLRGHPARWKTYVANRVSEVQRALPEARWHHVSGLENPADCASRGLPPSQLPEFSLWWSGPAWLSDPAGWDRGEMLPETTTELEAKTAGHVTAWYLRWRCPGQSKTYGGSQLATAELDAARTHWVTVVQHQEFDEEIRCLTSKHPLPRRSKLLRLTPYQDDQGVLRVGGRLRHSLLTPQEKHPIILPKEGHFTGLIVDEAHRRTLHGGTQLTLATLRQQYWILQGRQRVKAHIHRCLPCVRWKATSGQQLMGNLPAARVNPGRPFLQVGLDYAGPFLLLASRGRGQRCYKGYIAVFQCLATRALHLEMVSDYSTEAFIAALRQFTSRRGLCTVIHSDQGTNFVGAARELRLLVAGLTKESGGLRNHLLKEGITWKFNPPSAPHFGGTWEAAVKAVKHHLRRVIGEQRLTFEEWTTLLSQIEACLNSRPLQPLSDDPDDLSALTPGHFLIGDSLLSVPDPPVDGVPHNQLSRWHLLQQMRAHFWQRWTSEYLQTLQARNKWTHQHKQPRVNDLCLLRSELQSPAKWPLARVTKLHPGPDGLTRVVTVKTERSEFLRPIVKLIYLPFVQDENHATCN